MSTVADGELRRLGPEEHAVAAGLRLVHVAPRAAALIPRAASVNPRILLAGALSWPAVAAVIIALSASGGGSPVRVDAWPGTTRRP